MTLTVDPQTEQANLPSVEISLRGPTASFAAIRGEHVHTGKHYYTVTTPDGSKFSCVHSGPMPQILGVPMANLVNGEPVSVFGSEQPDTLVTFISVTDIAAQFRSTKTDQAEGENDAA